MIDSWRKCCVKGFIGGENEGRNTFYQVLVGKNKEYVFGCCGQHEFIVAYSARVVKGMEV